MKIHDTRYTVSRPTGVITERELRNGSTKWLDGTVRTPHGIAEVMASKSDGYSRVDFVWRGVHHIREWRGIAYTKQGLARKAAEFVYAVVEGKR